MVRDSAWKSFLGQGFGVEAFCCIMGPWKNLRPRRVLVGRISTAWWGALCYFGTLGLVSKLISTLLGVTEYL